MKVKSSWLTITFVLAIGTSCEKVNRLLNQGEPQVRTRVTISRPYFIYREKIVASEENLIESSSLMKIFDSIYDEEKFYEYSINIAGDTNPASNEFTMEFENHTLAENIKKSFSPTGLRHSFENSLGNEILNMKTMRSSGNHYEIIDKSGKKFIQLQDTMYTSIMSQDQHSGFISKLQEERAASSENKNLKKIAPAPAGLSGTVDYFQKQTTSGLLTYQYKSIPGTRRQVFIKKIDNNIFSFTQTLVENGRIITIVFTRLSGRGNAVFTPSKTVLKRD